MVKDHQKHFPHVRRGGPRGMSSRGHTRPSGRGGDSAPAEPPEWGREGVGNLWLRSKPGTGGG